jgi:hypothetical protein
MEDKVIKYWLCRLCRRRYNHAGLCEDCGEFLKPFFPSLPEVPYGEV